MVQITGPSALQYKTYKFLKDGGGYYSFVFNDIMGFERRINRGVAVADVRLALMGHVREGYKVQGPLNFGVLWSFYVNKYKKPECNCISLHVLLWKNECILILY